MLDSETNLREGFAKLTPPMANPDTPLAALPLDATALVLIDHFIDAALYFHEALIDKYEIDPHFLNPAISAGETLKAQFVNTRLIPVIEQMQSVLAGAQDKKRPISLALSLSELVVAAKPWLLEGAPKHYKDKEIGLYQDIETGRLFLQKKTQHGVSGEIIILNPYGNGEFRNIPWPLVMSDHSMKPLDEPAESPAGTSAPHAAHR